MDILDAIYEKPGSILMVQVDHISGEAIGTIIDDLYRAGAFNVQVIPTITKKNRPGHLFLIDGAPNDLEKIEEVILGEIGATGWHHLKSAHRHVGTEIIEREVGFDTPEGRLLFTTQIKIVKKKPDQMRPEHASCFAIREALREKGVHLSLTEIQQSIIQQVKSHN